METEQQMQEQAPQPQQQEEEQEQHNITSDPVATTAVNDPAIDITSTSTCEPNESIVQSEVNESCNKSTLSNVDIDHRPMSSVRNRASIFDKSAPSSPIKPNFVIQAPVQQCSTKTLATLSPAELLLNRIEETKQEIEKEKQSSLDYQAKRKIDIRKVLNSTKCWTILTNGEKNERWGKSNASMERIWTNIEQFLYGDANTSSIHGRRVSLYEHEAILNHVTVAIQKKKENIKSLQGKVDDLVCVRDAMIEKIKQRKIFGLIKASSIACCLPGNDPLLATFSSANEQAALGKQSGVTTPLSLLHDLKRIREDLNATKNRLTDAKKENESLTGMIQSGQTSAVV